MKGYNNCMCLKVQKTVLTEAVNMMIIEHLYKESSLEWHGVEYGDFSYITSLNIRDMIIHSGVKNLNLPKFKFYYFIV